MAKIDISLTSTQVRMAMAALGWSNAELADRADVSVTTVARFILDQSQSKATSDKIQEAFEKNGVAFIPEGEPSHYGGVGVRLVSNTVDYSIGEFYLGRIEKILDQTHMNTTHGGLIAGNIINDLRFEPYEHQHELLCFLIESMEAMADRENLSDQEYDGLQTLTEMLRERKNSVFNTVLGEDLDKAIEITNKVIQMEKGLKRIHRVDRLSTGAAVNEILDFMYCNPVRSVLFLFRIETPKKT